MDSTDNTNELDSYGVWVKHPAESKATESTNLETVNIDDAFELPDFPTEEEVRADQLDETRDAVQGDPTDMSSGDDEEIVQLKDYSDDLDVEIPEEPMAEDPFAKDELDEMLENVLDESETTVEVPKETTSDGLDETKDENVFDMGLDDLPENPFGDVSDDSEPVATEIVDETPVAEDTIIEEPAIDEITIEDPVVEDDIIEEPVVEDTIIEEPVVEEITIEEPVVEDAVVEETIEEPVVEDSIEEVSEEISIDDELPSFEMPAEEPAAVTEEAPADDFELPTEDGEVSLDDFMTEGFSDVSVAQGNSGYAPDEFASEDGEISLDDFLDGEDFMSDSGPKQEEIVDEQPLEMEMEFDNSVESVETEDNVMPEFDSATEETEEPTISQEPEDEAPRSTEVSGGTEEIDLSDFGIDANAEETPIEQDIEEAKMKEQVVDYELKVSDDENMASAPVVNEIKENTVQNEKFDTQKEANMNANSDLLQKIVEDLSSLKEEMNVLKLNIAELKNREHSSSPSPDTSDSDESSDEEPGGVIDLDFQDVEDNSSGFFDDSDGDDTIALSGNELDNIMNNVEISGVTAIEEVMPNLSEPTSIEEIYESADNNVEETVVAEEPEIEITETSVSDDEVLSEPIVESNDDEGFFSAADDDDAIALSGSELDNIMNSAAFAEMEPSDDTSASDNFIEEPVVEEPVIEEPVIEEPVIEDTENEISEELPEEIEIPKTESFAENSAEEVTESNLDYLNSDVSSETSVADEPIIEDDASDEAFASVSSFGNDDALGETVSEATDTGFSESEPTIQDDITEEPVTDEAFATVDSFENGEQNETISESVSEPAIEESAFAAPVMEETIPGEPVIEESEANSDPSLTDEHFTKVDSFENNNVSETPTETFAENEPAIENDFSNEIVEETPNEIEETSVPESEVQIPAAQEPTMQVQPAPTTETSSGLDSDLKQDIKSVLLYMDQLLENLPEEKIVEFAKSEEFATYKKLFSELGLS